VALAVGFKFSRAARPGDTQARTLPTLAIGATVLAAMITAGTISVALLDRGASVLLHHRTSPTAPCRTPTIGSTRARFDGSFQTGWSGTSRSL
jgi:hypothetical protein